MSSPFIILFFVIPVKSATCGKLRNVAFQNVNNILLRETDFAQDIFRYTCHIIHYELQFTQSTLPIPNTFFGFRKEKYLQPSLLLPKNLFEIFETHFNNSHKSFSLQSIKHINQIYKQKKYYFTTQFLAQKADSYRK